MLARDNLREGLLALSTALTDFGNAIKEAAGAAHTYNKKAISAYYNVLGQYTFPLDQEVYAESSKPPSVAELGPAQIPLFVVPVIPITFISSVTWIPLFGNSIQSFIKGFVQFANIPMLDVSPEERSFKHISIMGTDTGNDHRNFVRQVYGAPGYVVGAGFGLVAAFMVGQMRVLIESLESFRRTSSMMMNFALPANNQIKMEGIFSEDSLKHPLRRYGFGLPGVIIGAVFGGISALVIWAARGAWKFLKHNALSLAHAYARVTSLGAEVKDPTDPNRHWAKAYVLGLPGLIVGAVFGGISAFFAASAISLARAYAAVTNIALLDLEEKDRITVPGGDRHPAQNYVLGLPGLIIGGALGAISAVIVGVARGIWYSFKHSALSLVHSFVHVTNIALQDKMDDPTKTDPLRHWSKAYILGLPGLIVGAVFGGIAALVVASAISLARAYAAVTNIALLDLEEKDRIEIPGKDRHPAQNYVLGLPGLIIGGTLGAISAVIAGVARGIWYFLKHSALSLVHGFVHVTNIALKDKINDPTKTDPLRHWSKAYILGLPGLIVGAVFGGITALLVASAISLARAYAAVTNIALLDLEEKDRIAVPGGDRHPAQNYVLGLPGLIIGGALGAISAVIVGVARGIWYFSKHSVLSFVHGFVQATNIALHKDDEMEDPTLGRHWSKAYILGLPGLVVGAVFGGIAALIVASAISLAHAYAAVTNIALLDLEEKDRIEVPGKDRHPAQNYVLGLPGLIIGGTLGAISAVIVGVARGIWYFFKHSALSLVHGFVHVTNIALKDKMDDPTKTDPVRHWSKAYILGLPGLIVGAVFGGIAALFVASAISLAHAYAAVTNIALSAKHQMDVPGKDRHPAQNYVLGLPGLIIGGALGAISGVIIGIARGAWNWLLNSARSTKQTFAMLVNSALPANKQMDLPGIWSEERSPVKKYVVGIVGVIVGGVAGLLAASFILAGRGVWAWAKNTFYSWQALSGSLMNGAVHRAWYAGIGGDDRIGKDKILGGLGYVLACVTTAPVAILIFVVKNVLLLLGAGAFLLTFNLLVPPVRSYAPIFAPEETQDKTIQKFKNLYSSLTEKGEFEVDVPIKENASGEYSEEQLAKKRFSTTTEKLLNEILKAYRDYKKQNKSGDFLSSEEFSQTVQTIKESYQSGFMTTPAEVETIHNKIDQVAKFVKEYINGEVIMMPKPANEVVAKSMLGNWAALFYGEKKPAKPSQPTSDNDSDLMPRPL